MERQLKVESIDSSFKIGDVSRIFGIPSSTLRYWEKQGLVKFPRTPQGGYRAFSFQSLVDVADIVFARNVDMPLAEVAKMHGNDVDQMAALLDGLEEETMHKIAELGCVMEEIHRRRLPIKEWRILQLQPIHRVRAKLAPVYEFDFGDENMVREYLYDPSKAVDIISSEDPDTYEYGRFMDESDWDVIRPGDTHERSYLYGGLWMNAKRETNIREFWSEAEALGVEHGSAICRYLFSAEKEGQGYCHFFEAWLELNE